MQREIRYIRSLVVAVAAIVCGLASVGSVSAQQAAMNAYSPYTMYGIGELGTLGNTINRTMGGTGVAMRSTQMASLLNPAGYSATLPKSFMLEVGIEGNFLKNQQRKYSGASADVYSTAANARIQSTSARLQCRCLSLRVWASV